MWGTNDSVSLVNIKVSLKLLPPPLLLLTAEDKQRPPLKCQSFTITSKQTCASTLRDITGGRGRSLLWRWHLFLSKSTASKGHRLIMLFTAVKIHIVEMSWHYYSSISSAAVIFSRRTSVNVKQWPGHRNNNGIKLRQIYYQPWLMSAEGAEFFISFTSARRL